MITCVARLSGAGFYAGGLGVSKSPSFIVGLASLGLATAVLLGGCADPAEVVDAGVDAGMDAAFPDADVPDAAVPDAAPPDAEIPDAEPMDARVGRKVRANGLAPAVGNSANGVRRVQGAISSPTGGESSNAQRRVRSVIGAPRSRN